MRPFYTYMLVCATDRLQNSRSRPHATSFARSRLAIPSKALVDKDLVNILPPQFKQLHEEFEKDARNVHNSVEQAGTDVITTAAKAGGDSLRTLSNASGDSITSLQKAGTDSFIAVKKAGSDVVATYEKGWRDRAKQTKRSFNDAVDPGKAVARFTESQAKAPITAMTSTERRAREAKVVDALWGAAVEPAQSAEENFSKAIQESDVLAVSAQAAATAYGPAGAAAYAAWRTYKTTGDANLALKAGAEFIVKTYAGGSVANMPAGTAGEVLRKAGVTGAVAGMAAAAAGGDEKAVTGAVLISGGAVLVQGASDQLTAYSPNAHNVIETVQCISARDVDCLSNTTYAKDVEGKLLYDKDGPRIEPTKLDPKQYVGQWTGIDPRSAEGKKNQVVTAISEIPQTHAIPIDDNEWVFTWTLGKSKTLELNKPYVVLTYVGRGPPFYSCVSYKKDASAAELTGESQASEDIKVFTDLGTLTSIARKYPNLASTVKARIVQLYPYLAPQNDGARAENAEAEQRNAEAEQRKARQCEVSRG